MPRFYLPFLLGLFACNGDEPEDTDDLAVAPTAPVVGITPATPTTTDDLVAVIVEDSDTSGTPTYAYVWTSSAGGSAEGATLAAAATTRGETWTVTVIPTADGLTGLPGTAQATIANTAPALASVAFDPAVPADTAPLTCVPGATSDADGDSVTVVATWTVDGTTVSETSLTLGPQHFGPGDAVKCTAVPTDGLAQGAAVSVEAVVGNQPPTLDAVRVNPTVATAETNLTCALGPMRDPDGDPITVAYGWRIDGVAVPGATNATLFAGTHVRGDVVVCTATPSDPSAAGLQVVSPGKTIVNAPPLVAGVGLTNPATTDTTLTCTPSLDDSDGDPVTAHYAWTVDGSAAGTDSSTLAGSAFSKGQVVRCTVTANDTFEDGLPAFGDVTIGNSAPTAFGVTLTPATAYTDTSLTCGASTSDPDGDVVTVQYAWTVDGSAVSGQTEDTLDGTWFAKGQTVRCTATPTDGTTAGVPTNSSQITISNSPPTLTSATLTPSTAYTATTVTCTPNGWADDDLDAPATPVTYAWTVDGSTVSGETGNTLDGIWFAKGQTVQCTATPTDGTANGTATNSNTVIISNTAPTTPTAATITPTSPLAQQDDLVCGMSGSTDADGDPISYQAEWQFQNYAGTYVAFTQVESGTNVNDEVNAADTASCRLYRCRARASDGSTTSSYSSYGTAKTVGAAPGCGACATGSSTAGPYSAYGRCWYLSDPGQSCDQVCSSQSSENIGPTTWNAWPDNCSAAGTQDVSTWFFQHGNPGGWTASTTATTYKTLGYGLTGSAHYGKCAANTGMGHGTWPGDTTQVATRSLACACGTRQWEYESSNMTTYPNSSLVWGMTFRPTKDTALYQYRSYMSLTVPVGATCPLHWYVFESSAGAYNGPWTVVASGSSTSSAAAADWRYSTAPLNVLMKKDYSYWMAFGSTCAQARSGNNGLNSLPTMGTVLGYCYQSDYSNPPTSPVCISAPISGGVPWDAYLVAP